MHISKANFGRLPQSFYVLTSLTKPIFYDCNQSENLQVSSNACLNALNLDRIYSLALSKEEIFLKNGNDLVKLWLALIQFTLVSKKINCKIASIVEDKKQKKK